MKKKSKILIAIGSIAIAGIIGVGAWQFDNIKKLFANANSSITQPVTPPAENPEFINCGAYSSSGEQVMSWQSLLDEEYIEVTDKGIGATAKFVELEVVNLKVPSIYTEIAPYAFKDIANLKSIELPEGITTLHFECFKNCTGLENISYPSTAIYVVDNVFEGCTSLNFYEYENIQYLGNAENNYVFLAHFKEHDNYENPIIHEETLVIGEVDFDNSYQPRELVFPKNIVAINSNTLYSTFTYIPKTVQVVAYKDEFGGSGQVFVNDGSTHYVYCEAEEAKDNWGKFNYSSDEKYVKYSVSFEKYFVYQGCRNDTAGLCVKQKDDAYTWQELLDNNYISVDDNGCLVHGSNFSNSPFNLSFYKFVIPEGVVSIGESFFEGLNYTGGVIIPDSLKIISKKAFASTKINISSLKNVETIEESAFEFHTSIQFIDMNSVKYIGANAFKGSKLRVFNGLGFTDTIILPNSVEHVGLNAFESVSSWNSKYAITKVILSNKMTTFDISSFLGISTLKAIYIPNSITTITFNAEVLVSLNNINFYFETSSIDYINLSGLTLTNTFINVTADDFKELTFSSGQIT